MYNLLPSQSNSSAAVCVPWSLPLEGLAVNSRMPSASCEVVVSCCLLRNLKRVRGKKRLVGSSQTNARLWPGGQIEAKGDGGINIGVERYFMSFPLLRRRLISRCFHVWTAGGSITPARERFFWQP
ncbi:hypothetical protein CERZMDRAFT_85086 [Cercospora zeae-maydis SCOH1-5]|uniref:Uncharacterized protein n=1 Tax=Cercospora zeae-maydis SCOH1-5 TaxID=717836 RepID=A0A6A6FE01_9PEZI|nr:hypothetical protein CERZMDRAFT_85086 [Cercospora zeae-maydis SCOH1-5]